MASIEVENILMILELSSHIGGIILLLGLAYSVGDRTKSDGEKTRLFWKVVLNIRYATALLFLWVTTFLIVPLFVPSAIQVELFTEILTNWVRIIFPVVPIGLLTISLITKYSPSIRQSLRDNRNSENGDD
jgi:hypothetical protein